MDSLNRLSNIEEVFMNCDDFKRNLYELEEKINGLRREEHYLAVGNEDLYNKILSEYPNLEDVGIYLSLVPGHYLLDANTCYLIPKKNKPIKIIYTEGMHNGEI